MNNSNNSSTVLVAGATGFLGGEICRQLIGKNKKVKGLVRTTSDANKVAQLKELGVEIVEGDLKDKSFLRKCFAGSFRNHFHRFFNVLKAGRRLHSNSG